MGASDAHNGNCFALHEVNGLAEAGMIKLGGNILLVDSYFKLQTFFTLSIHHRKIFMIFSEKVHMWDFRTDDQCC